MNGVHHLRGKATYGSMVIGVQEMDATIGCRDDGTAHRTQVRIGAIRTMTDTGTAGTITKGIGIVTITSAMNIVSMRKVAVSQDEFPGEAF
jgi:hypothetical protein